ncbi:MAG: aminotransferase class V-fold PLP-dependent enzyme [Gemmatimonadota bacterium]
MERRRFVRDLAAGLAALQLVPELAAALSDRLQALAADLAGAADDAAFWARVRQEFLLREGLTHLNCGSIGATPRPVVEALVGYIQRLETDPYPYTWSGFPEAALDEVRERAGEFLGAAGDEVLITRNTTEGMNLVATAMRLQAGDEVLTTDHEHPGGVFGWLYAAEQAGARVVQCKLPTPPSDADQIVQLIEDHLTPRTRVVMVSHVTTMTGLQMPLARIAQITRPRDILLVCDGAQAPGMLRVYVEALGVDVYASSSHKWMLAPKGSGLLYVNRRVQDRIRPVSAWGGYQVYSASSGTRDVPHVLAHADTMAFHQTLGLERIEARCRQLNAYLRQRLAAIPVLELLTPADPELSSGIVSYRLRRGSHATVRQRLMEERDIIVKPIPGNYVFGGNPVPAEGLNALRISTHIFNSEADVDRLADALADMLGASTAVDGDQLRPRAIDLGQNWPNPFNPSTQIRYELPAAGPVRLEVLNARGQMVDVLVDGWQAPGAHAVTWDAGQRASGTYFYRLRAGGLEQARKMALVR